MLFELRIRQVVAPIGNGKDLKANAIAEDGFDYALKRQEDHPLLPATEWFCYQVAQSCGLSCPRQALLVNHDGKKYLGSRIEQGLHEMSVKPLEQVIQELKGCAGTMSAAYAMDLFLANDDRHFGNFLFRPNSYGQMACMPIDYSRAWWVRGWPPRDLTDPKLPSTTTNHVNIMRAVGLWRPADALVTLSKISQIKPDAAKLWMKAMPAEWIGQSETDTLLKWWGSTDFHGHLSKCIEYCKQP